MILDGSNHARVKLMITFRLDTLNLPGYFFKLGFAKSKSGSLYVVVSSSKFWCPFKSNRDPRC